MKEIYKKQLKNYGFIYSIQDYMKQKKSAEQQNIQKQIKDKFKILMKVGSGAYGHVWKVQAKQNHQIYALKKIFSAFQNDVDAQRTFRQIAILRKCIHPNIIKLHQIIKAQNDMDLYLLFDYMDSDLFNAIRDNVLNEIHKKYIIYQLAKVLKYLHAAGIVHRDLKPSNILLNQSCILKLCDFGLSRTLFRYNDQQPILTEFIATRWYRAPQVLFGSKKYDQSADLWSLGCLIYQLYAGHPLLPGNDSLDQIHKVLEFKGEPNEQQKKSMKVDNIEFILSHFNVQRIPFDVYMNQIHNQQVRQLLVHLLEYNPQKRWTPGDILNSQLLQEFKGFETIILPQKEIKIYPNDNNKLSSSAYINLINRFYLKKQMNTKRNILMQLKNSRSLHLGQKSFHSKENSNSFSLSKSPYISNSKRIVRKHLKQIQSKINQNKLKTNPICSGKVLQENIQTKRLKRTGKGKCAQN